MIESIKDLEKLLKLCRKQGVLEISVNGVSFKLGELPNHSTQIIDEDETDDKYENFPDGPLTAEELTFFANGGRPEDNPYSKTAPLK
jgi:hypothetical protein